MGRNALFARTLATLGLLFGTAVSVPSHVASAAPMSAPRACKVLNSTKDLPAKPAATSLSTVEQGYRCLLAHYVTGKRLDDRVLLRGAYQALAKQFGQRTLDLAGASSPSLTGDREGDWQAFRAAYESLTGKLPGLAMVQQALAELALIGMTGSLHDDHTAYLPAQFMKPAVAQLFDDGPQPSLGLVTTQPTGKSPFFITDVYPHSPAADVGLQPGDVIDDLGGQPPFTKGQPALSLISFVLPQVGSPVQVTVRRPATGEQLTVTISPRLLVAPTTTARVLAGNIAYVKLFAFTTHAARHLFASLNGLGLGSAARGIVLDLRGNGGGAADQALRIMGAFIHKRTVAYEVNGAGHREPQRTGTAQALLHLPLVVLIDDGSASSSELVAGAVRDLHLGKLIGVRSAGALGGAEFYALNDGSGMELTEVRVLGALGERIDGIGVAPDVRAPLTAAELSRGQDPAIDQAVRYLSALGT